MLAVNILREDIATASLAKTYNEDSDGNTYIIKQVIDEADFIELVFNPRLFNSFRGGAWAALSCQNKIQGWDSKPHCRSAAKKQHH